MDIKSQLLKDGWKTDGTEWFSPRERKWMSMKEAEQKHKAWITWVLEWAPARLKRKYLWAKK